MKIKKQKVVQINMDVFNSYVYVITRKKDLKIMKKDFKESYKGFKKDKDFVGRCVGNGYVNYIYIKDGSVATLAHEILHCIERICERNGFTDEEVKCWIMHHIIEQVVGR